MPRCLCRRASANERGPQIFVVMRHSERLDFTDEDAWFADPASDIFPKDTPITETGWEYARVQGRLVAELCALHEVQIDAIISSPYLRCIQTALAVREVLPSPSSERGETTTQMPLLLDVELSEVNLYSKPKGTFDAETLHEYEEFWKRRRTYEEVRALPDLKDVPLSNHGDFAGRPPPWPERRRDAHIRGLCRFAEWIERGREGEKPSCYHTSGFGARFLRHRKPERGRSMYQLLRLGSCHNSTQEGPKKRKNEQAWYGGCSRLLRVN